MVDMKSTQAFLYFECNTQIVVFILNELHCSSSPRRRYFFILDKEYISVNTKSKNTEKQQCVHLGVRDSASTNLLFSEITLISLLTNQNLITVDSERTAQNSFGYLKCSNPNKNTIKCRCLF